MPLFIAALFFLTIYLNNSPCAAKVIFYPIYREYKKQSFIFDCREFSVLEGQNCRILYRDINQDTLKLIKDGVDENLNNVLRDFDYKFNSKIYIIVYPEYEEMARKIGLNGGSIAMGVYYGGIVSVLDPVKWIQNGSNISEVFKKDGPMVHELSHFVTDYMASGNLPVWFTEGVALYEEYRINGVKWGDSKNYTQYYDITELEKDFYNLDEVKAYKQCFLVVKYIGDNYGMEGITRIIKELKGGRTIDQAIKSVLNMNKQELFKKGMSAA